MGLAVIVFAFDYCLQGVVIHNGLGTIDPIIFWCNM